MIKQIARQLRIQYVESIYRPNYPVTLKSRLRLIGAQQTVGYQQTISAFTVNETLNIN